MFKRSTIVAVCGALFGVAALAGSASSSINSSETSYLTFGGPVRLPGVTLGSGTYVFELADPTMNRHLVRVRNRATSQVCFLGFTQQVPRPRGLAEDHQIVFRETVSGVAPQIDAWYPAGEVTGEQFTYPHNR